MQTAHLGNPLFLQSPTPKILNTDLAVETKHFKTVKNILLEV